MTDPTTSRLERVFGRCRCAGPVPPAVIQQAEHRLGLSFPPSYRAFLARFGAAREGSLSVEIAGIDHRRDINETPLWTDVVRDTLRDHADATVPQRYLRISDDGMACAYYLDAGVEDGPVVALGPGRRDFEIVAPTFLDFVELATGEFPP